MSARAFPPSCRATMSPFSHMVNLAQANHTRWALQGPAIRATRKSWVWASFNICIAPLRNLADSSLGIIPRAAAVLFDKLEGGSHSSRIAGSSIRPPSRISTVGMPNLSKSSGNKNWQLKATYVEVRPPTDALESTSLLTSPDL